MLNYDVHGNITYAEETELGYMIGFDCAHCWDIVPSIHKIVPNRKSSFFEQTYKTVDFVTDQSKKLAEQIANDDAKKFDRLKIEEV